MTTLTAQEFNRDVSRAKRAAESGPVFITQRGRTTHVLLTSADYRARIAPLSVLDALRPDWVRQAGGSEGLELPLREELPRAAELD
jgi:PHD/YefM family antitoxin component YafN of YafNO toxin-antitoxin module